MQILSKYYEEKFLIFDLTKHKTDYLNARIKYNENLNKHLLKEYNLNINCDIIPINFISYCPLAFEWRLRTTSFATIGYLNNDLFRSWMVSSEEYLLDKKLLVPIISNKLFKINSFSYEKCLFQLKKEPFFNSGKKSDQEIFDYLYKQKQEANFMFSLFKFIKIYLNFDIKITPFGKIPITTDLLIGLDNTSSGFQIQQLMINNSFYGKELNFFSNESVNDLYNITGEHFFTEIQNKVKKISEKILLAEAIFRKNNPTCDPIATNTIINKFDKKNNSIITDVYINRYTKNESLFFKHKIKKKVYKKTKENKKTNSVINIFSKERNTKEEIKQYDINMSMNMNMNMNMDVDNIENDNTDFDNDNQENDIINHENNTDIEIDIDIESDIEIDEKTYDVNHKIIDNITLDEIYKKAKAEGVKITKTVYYRINYLPEQIAYKHLLILLEDLKTNFTKETYRKIIKLLIMPASYNATESLKKPLRQALIDINSKFKNNISLINFFIKNILHFINEDMHLLAINKLMKPMIKAHILSKNCKKKSREFFWYHLSGAYIIPKYKKRVLENKEDRFFFTLVNPFAVRGGVIKNARKTLILARKKDDYNKLSTSTTPNIIHSIDSALMHHIVLELDYIFCIHDCFLMKICYQKTFQAAYSNILIDVFCGNDKNYFFPKLFCKRDFNEPLIVTYFKFFFEQQLLLNNLKSKLDLKLKQIKTKNYRKLKVQDLTKGLFLSFK